MEEANPCRTERLARLLRQDLTAVSVTTPWESSEERERYRRAVVETYRRLREPPAPGESSYHDQVVKETRREIAEMARAQAAVLIDEELSWSDQAAREFYKFADELESYRK